MLYIDNMNLMKVYAFILNTNWKTNSAYIFSFITALKSDSLLYNNDLNVLKFYILILDINLSKTSLSLLNQ